MGVVLAPVLQSGWNSQSASAFFDSIGQALPDALSWPVRLARARRVTFTTGLNRRRLAAFPPPPGPRLRAPGRRLFMGAG